LDPHPKKILREQSLEQVQGEGSLFDISQWSCKHILLKLKLGEFAKKGKFPRVISDLSGNLRFGQNVLSSMVGMGFIDDLKHLMEIPYIYTSNGLKCIMMFVAGPVIELLQEALALIYTGEYKGCFYDFRFIYYSDDSCFGYTRGGQHYYGNMDISSCDASHGPAIFEVAQHIGDRVGQSFLMSLLIQQLRCDIHIPFYDVVNDKVIAAYTGIFKCNNPRLASGSVLTTFINNLACVYLGVMIAQEYSSGTTNCILEGSRRAGYFVTYDMCECPEKLQFLKHSPIMCCDNGFFEYVPTMNLGPFFRQDGLHVDVYAKNGKSESVIEAAMRHRKEVFKGLYAYVTFGCQYDPLDEVSKYQIDHHSLGKRYDLCDVCDLIDVINSTTPYTMDTRLGDAWLEVMRVDYGW